MLVRVARVLPAVLLTALLAACDGAVQADTTPAPPPVDVAVVVQRNVTDWDAFTGRFEAPERVELRPRVSGYIDAVSFEEGGLVEQGQALFRIDPRPYQAVLDRARAELARAEAQHELAGRELERAEELLQSRVIPAEAYDRRLSRHAETGAGLASARAAVQAAALDVSFTVVTAPISGRVSRADVTPGNFVTAGATRLTTIVSIDPIYVYFEGDEQTFLEYTRRPEDAAQEVRVGLAGEAGAPHRGHLDFVDNAVDPATGTIRARAVLDNPDGRFTPGLFARVELASRDTLSTTLLDPRAIGTDQDRRFVYVVAENGNLEYRTVAAGDTVEGLRVVHTGVEPGERVVVGSLAMLHAGMIVDPRPASTPGQHPAIARN